MSSAIAAQPNTYPLGVYVIRVAQRARYGHCMAKDSIPTGRLRRTARIGGLAGGTAARSYAARAADLTRSEQKRQEAAERRQVQMAERILDVLGQMKGAAMKIGQVASFVDSGALPPEVHRRLEEKLAELRDSAPRVRFDEMRKVLESDLGGAARGRVRRVRDRRRSPPRRSARCTARGCRTAGAWR